MLTALRADPKLGEAAMHAIKQIQSANGGASAVVPRKPWWKRFVP